MIAPCLTHRRRDRARWLRTRQRGAWGSERPRPHRCVPRSRHQARHDLRDRCLRRSAAGPARRSAQRDIGRARSSKPLGSSTRSGPFGRCQRQRSEDRVHLRRLPDLLEREVLVGAVDGRTAGSEDHRRHLLPEAGRVAEPVLDDRAGGSSPRTSRTAVRISRTTSSSGAARYPDFTSASTTSARKRGSASAASSRHRSISARTSSIVDARLRATIHADHAVVGDHRRSARCQAAVDPAGHDVGLGPEQIDRPTVPARARTSRRRARAPPAPRGRWR